MSPSPPLPGNDRTSPRTSMFLLATMRRLSAGDELTLRIRNLSSTGLCGDSDHPVQTNEQLIFTIPSVGSVEGTIAWCEANRFGVAFATEIDPGKARRPLTRPDANSNILPPVRDHRRPGIRSISSPDK